MEKLSLSSCAWTVRPLEKTPVEVPANLSVPVPGSAHTALTAAGVIGDVWQGQNEKLQHWVGQTAWQFATELPEPAAGERVDLVCDGLDTVATLRLGETVVGESQNMHRRYRFDVTEAIRGSRELTIDFAAAVKEVDRRSFANGPRPQVNHHPYNALRKMACSFGWDWGPDTATCGIWRDIRLESWSTARLARVLTDARTQDGRGTVTVTAEVERLDDRELTVTATIGDARASATIAPGRTSAQLMVELDEVELWWPVGHGQPTTYPIEVVLSADAELDRVERRIGFRTVEWRTEPDETGTTFSLVLNGRLVEVHGVNWIPDHTDVATITRARLEERFQQALACNTNLIRVWGGGTYESEDFYDLADELGLMVWQDFPFACASYAEEPWLADEVEAEARDNVARLAHRPSLVLWNGNNECLEGFSDWGWAGLLNGATWGHGYYFELLPQVVADLGNGVPYTPGSPWSPTGEGIEVHADLSPNDEHHGSKHIWDMWNRRPATEYRAYRPHFVAEFGWQGPPTWTTMQDFGDDPLTPESPGTFVHQKAAGGNDKLTAGLLPNADLPLDIERWHWAMQWNQAEAIRLAITWYRSLFPHCTGTVTWQLNDCWPVVSWAAIDGHGRPKPLFHALRQANAPRLLTIQPIDGTDVSRGLRVTLVNDTDEAVAEDLVVRRVDHTGAELARFEQALTCDARSAVTVELGEVATAGDASRELLLAECDGQRATWFFATPRDSALEPADLDVTVEDQTVVVTARNLVRDLTLLIDKADPDARVLDGLVTLLPGESHRFEVTGRVDADGARRAVASVNDLVVKA